MGRISREIEVGGRRFWAMFDTGSKNTYVLGIAADAAGNRASVPPRGVALGGRAHSLTEGCYLRATIEGHAIEGDAYVIDTLGHDDFGRPIDILIGALMMQKWCMRLVLDEERLDLDTLSLRLPRVRSAKLATIRPRERRSCYPGNAQIGRSNSRPGLDTRIRPESARPRRYEVLRSKNRGMSR